MDGCDIIFKLMLYVELKIFFIGIFEVRVRRRVFENKDKGFEINYDVVLVEVKVRDYVD